MAKYEKRYCDEIIRYFDKPAVIFHSENSYYPDGTIKGEKTISEAIEFPTFQGFRAKIGVHVSTLYLWKDRHKEFEKAYNMAKQLQEKIWLVNSMNGFYNSSFAQFFGKNCLGYKEKSEQEVKSDGFRIIIEDKDNAAD